MMIVRDQRGFTLAELMVATLITTIVLGGANQAADPIERVAPFLLAGGILDLPHKAPLHL